MPGRSPQRLVLVAHYDTWRGPGADDNTTGEEIVKQYLVAALRAAQRPPLTHTYLLAGSEECGLIGFTSQLVLGIGLSLSSVAWAQGVYAMAALSLLLVPLAMFRFGVSGSREYVRALSAAERELIEAAVSVDSVGEGRLYIPESALGATSRALSFPSRGTSSSTTSCRRPRTCTGSSTTPTSPAAPPTTSASSRAERPAAALVALTRGKASPLVLGGKIHTCHDTADRVYPEPLRQTLRILEYPWHLLQGGTRLAEPRELDEFHYAQLYRVRRPGAEEEHWLALKDAVEPNRRNLNGLYLVDVVMADGTARCERPRIAGWGVDTRMAADLNAQLPPKAARERLRARRVELQAPDGVIVFERDRSGLDFLTAALHDAIGALERFMGANTFLTFFGGAFVLAKVVEAVMAQAFRWPALQELFFRYFLVTLPLTIVFQLCVVVWLIGKKIPTMIDNAYWHLNKADNLRSLRRVRG